MMIEVIILSSLILLLIVSIFLKNFWLGVACVIGLILYGLYYFFFRKTLVTFLFINDAQNVEEHPEVYCGEDLILPEDYDVYGTRYKCLKKGIGTGMSLSNDDRERFLTKIRQPPVERVYCGNSNDIPNGFDRNGTLLECFKKGVGTGLGMPQQKRLEFQQKPSRIGKMELIKLADKFKINHDTLTREQTRDMISDRIRLANL